MRNLIIVFIILINFSFLLSQNSAPEVTNVNFSQRLDGSFIVDVYYDLNDVDGDTMLVTMQVSEDSGTTWLFTCDSASGDVGEGILTGTSKHIVWDFGTEHPQSFGDAFRIRIIADDHVLKMGTVTDIDGNVYQTVKIGLQWWMAENLKVTHYRNGDNIPQATDTTWWGLTTGAYWNYDRDTTYVSTYGRLYNWYAVDDSNNIAPAGWHVPGDDEWKQLEMYLGMSQSQANDVFWRGTDEGGKMKEAGTAHWNSPNTGATNSSGFTALPGGGFDDYFNWFGFIGEQGCWWSATECTANYAAWYRNLDFDNSRVNRVDYIKWICFSVRCVKD